MSWDVWIAVPVTSTLCSLSSAAGAALSACALAEMRAPTARPAALKAASEGWRLASIFRFLNRYRSMLTRIIIIYIAVPFRIQAAPGDGNPMF